MEWLFLGQRARHADNRLMSSFGRWFFRFALAGSLAAALGYLPHRASGGIGRSMQLKQRLTALVAGNLRTTRENRLLREQIRRLSQDRRAIERVARDELGLFHPDDVLFQFNH